MNTETNKLAIYTTRLEALTFTTTTPVLQQPGTHIRWRSTHSTQRRPIKSRDRHPLWGVTVSDWLKSTIRQKHTLLTLNGFLPKLYPVVPIKSRDRHPPQGVTVSDWWKSAIRESNQHCTQVVA